MKYVSRFSIGDVVWMVRNQRFERIIKCFPCANTGKVKILLEEFICPKCGGRAAHTQYTGQKYYIYSSSSVGKVTIEDYPNNWREGEPNPKFSYMLHETGVGSGQCWDEKDLFSSKQEAQDFCDLRNGILLPDETEALPSPVDEWGKIVQP